MIRVRWLLFRARWANACAIWATNQTEYNRHRSKSRGFFRRARTLHSSTKRKAAADKIRRAHDRYMKVSVAKKRGSK